MGGDPWHEIDLDDWVNTWLESSSFIIMKTSSCSVTIGLNLIGEKIY